MWINVLNRGSSWSEAGEDLTLVTSLAKYALYRWSRADSCLIRVHIRCRIMNSKKKIENACWTQNRSIPKWIFYCTSLYFKIHTLRLLDCFHFRFHCHGCQWGTRVGGTCVGSVIVGCYRTRLQSERKWLVNRQITIEWLLEVTDILLPIWSMVWLRMMDRPQSWKGEEKWGYGVFVRHPVREWKMGNLMGTQVHNISECEVNEGLRETAANRVGIKTYGCDIPIEYIQYFEAIIYL